MTSSTFTSRLVNSNLHLISVWTFYPVIVICILTIFCFNFSVILKIFQSLYFLITVLSFLWSNNYRHNKLSPVVILWRMYSPFSYNSILDRFSRPHTIGESIFLPAFQFQVQVEAPLSTILNPPKPVYGMEVPMMEICIGK